MLDHVHSAAVIVLAEQAFARGDLEPRHEALQTLHGAGSEPGEQRDLGQRDLRPIRRPDGAHEASSRVSTASFPSSAGVNTSIEYSGASSQPNPPRLSRDINSGSTT